MPPITVVTPVSSSAIIHPLFVLSNPSVVNAISRFGEVPKDVITLSSFIINSFSGIQ
ncbi:hypothetical protein K8O96_12340 [Clostridium sporogenes]|nr:hypothetical protein K8O96_12340 [Clostridium sporogenes]